jgi:hypothetical protein
LNVEADHRPILSWNYQFRGELPIPSLAQSRIRIYRRQLCLQS